MSVAVHDRRAVRVLSVLLPALVLVAFVAFLVWGREELPTPGPDPVLKTPLTRASLRLDAFGTKRLPRTLPAVQPGWHDARFPYAARIDRLTVPLDAGFTSVAYDLWPRRSNGRTMIFHNGHGRDLNDQPWALRWFLARGWRVVTMAMPLAGQNAFPGFERDVYHEQLVILERPLEVFLEPVIAVVNYTHADTMVGLSGGGWTTVITAAIDPRIRRSYPVAGSIPWPWRCRPGRPGCYADLEQRIIPNYIRLYELGSQAGQRQLALYNLNDPCCFSGSSSRIWASRVHGNFEAVIDRTAIHHQVTEFHLRAITRDLARP
jgi:hypothetical protein